MTTDSNVVIKDTNRLWSSLVDNAPSFLNKVLLYTQEVGIDIHGLEIDHMGIRIADKKNVNTLATSLNRISVGQKPLAEVSIKDRPILTYKLQKPFYIAGFSIPCIELPYPATPHDFQSDGWEHIEVVLPGNGDIEDKFNERFPDFSGSYEVSSPNQGTGQLPNETLSIRNPADKMLCIKFHSLSIEEVVKKRYNN